MSGNGIWVRLTTVSKRRLRAIWRIFTRRGDAERQRRRWLPGLALAVAAPVFLLLGVMIEQQFLIVPLNDPSRGWSGHIWDNYGPTIANCAMEAKRKSQVVKCPLEVHKP